MTQAIVLSSQIEEAIETAVKDCNVLVLAELSPLQQAVRLATGMQALRQALTVEIMNQVFMPLQGSKLGFVTDKDKPPWNASPDELRNFRKGYPVEIVRDCMIEALMNGLRPVNNEFNIIANNMYAAKNGLYRLVCEFPGIDDFEIANSVPVFSEKGDSAKIAIRATWKLNGVEMSLAKEPVKLDNGNMDDRRITIRVNKGMGADAVIGKAERKMYHAILMKLRRTSGITLTIADGEAMDVPGHEIAEPAPPPVPPEQDGKRMKLGQKPAAPPADQPRMREPGED